MSTTPPFIVESSATYHAKAGEYLSSHLLADFRKSPKLYHRRITGVIPREDSTAWLIGRAAHTMILEGREVFEKAYAVGGPINEKTGQPYGQATKAWAEWLALQGGKDAVTFDQLSVIEEMAAAVKAHKEASAMLAGGTAEAVIRSTLGTRKVQSRLDWYCDSHGIVDLKTCDDLTWFESDAKRYGYIYQMAFYRAVLQAATSTPPFVGKPSPVYIMAVEKKEPYRCGVFEVGQDALAMAESENTKAISRLIYCEQTGEWPTGYEARRVLCSLD